MILYHGSNIAITQIDLSKSKTNKDFGQGFYLSDSEQQAIEMANYKTSLFGENPIVTRFEFNEAVFSNNNSLRIKIFKDYSEEWADFVFANREGNPTQNFDIVYGPIANDKVGLQIRKFKDGTIDKIELLNRLRYMKGITFQYYFGSEEAIRHLTIL